MRRFVTMSMLVSVVLLVGGICFAQDKQTDAAGAKADPSDMWAAYKKMWEGEWTTTIAMPDGGELKCESTIEVILDGNAVQITRTWSLTQGTLKMKALGSWCPKRKAIVIHEVNSHGGRTESVVTLVNGEERNSLSHFAPDGTEESSRVVTTVIDSDTYQLKFVEGRFAGGELTWIRKKK